MTGAVKVTCKLMWLEKLLAEISPGSLSKTKRKRMLCSASCLLSHSVHALKQMGWQIINSRRYYRQPFVISPILLQSAQNGLADKDVYVKHMQTKLSRIQINSN